MNDRRPALAALLAVLFLATAACAEPDDDGWTEFKAPPSPGGVIPPTTSEGGYASPDRTQFSERLRSGVLEQLCRAVKLQHDFNFGIADFAGTGFGLERYMTPYPDGTYALVDIEKTRASLFHSFAHDFGGASVSAGLSLTGSIEGQSMVVRRLGTKRSCDGIKELVNLRDIKTVLPVSAERLAAMQPGELWRIPFTLTYGQSVSVGAAQATPAAVGAVSISFGRSDAGSASMTLYRIADDKLRFRFRIDHVVVHSQSLGVTETFPAVAFAGHATNILGRFMDRQIAAQVAHYASAWMTYGRSSSDGAKIVMEFVVDPRDPEQAQALAAAVKGDIYELVRMGLRMSTLRAKPEQALADYRDLQGEHERTLGDAAYAASDRYAAKLRSFSLNLPFIIAHNSSKLFGDDAVTLYTGEGGEYHYYRSDKSGSNALFTVPLLGAIVKDNNQRAAETVTFAPIGRPHTDPLLVYTRNQGYLREPAGSVRDTIDEMNGILKLAGAQRGDRARALMLPVDALVPPSPPLPASNSPHGTDVGPREPSDRKGMVSLTLVFNQQAVRDMLSATDDAVIRAFAASTGLSDRTQAEWLAENAKITPQGATYDLRAASKVFDDMSPGMKNSWQGDLRTLSADAAHLLADLAAARDAKDNVARSEAVARLVGGRGKGDLAYENVLRVLVQLVDPMDVTGDFVENVQASSKGVKSVSSHLVLKNGRAEVPLLKGAGETKNRFAQPSILVD